MDGQLFLKFKEQKAIDMLDCFVIMPFGQTTEKHTEEYWNDHFMHFIKPAVEGASDGQKLIGYLAKIANPSNGAISEDVFNSLQDADVVLAELTDLSPNVMYELGIRHCLHDRTIMIIESGQEIPFYFKNYKVITYSNTTPKNTNDFKEKIQHCLLNLASPPSITSDNPVFDYLRGRGQRIQITPNQGSDITLPGQRESGFSAMYVSSTNSRRNDRKEEVLLEANQHIKILALTGFAYLAKVGSYFRDELFQRLQANMRIQIILPNPWSETTILVALGELTEGPLAPVQKLALDKLANGNLTDIDPIELIEESIYFSERYPASIRGYLSLRKLFGECIELRISPHTIPATILLTEQTGFFEPYIHVNVSERRRKSMNTFELEFPSSNYLYRHCTTYFDTLWKFSLSYERFIETENDWKAQLRDNYEKTFNTSSSST